MRASRIAWWCGSSTTAEGPRNRGPRPMGVDHSFKPLLHWRRHGEFAPFPTCDGVGRDLDGFGQLLLRESDTLTKRPDVDDGIHGSTAIFIGVYVTYAEMSILYSRFAWRTVAGMSPPRGTRRRWHDSRTHWHAMSLVGPRSCPGVDEAIFRPALPTVPEGIRLPAHLTAAALLPSGPPPRHSRRLPGTAPRRPTRDLQDSG